MLLSLMCVLYMDALSCKNVCPEIREKAGILLIFYSRRLKGLVSVTSDFSLVFIGGVSLAGISGRQFYFEN